MAGKKYTSLAKSAPSHSTKAGVDDYKVVGGGPQGGAKGKKKSLGKMKKTKTNQGM